MTDHRKERIMMKKTREMFVAAANLSLVRALCGGKIEVYASEDCTIVAGFVGKRAKPSMYYRFSTVEKAAEYADKWVDEESKKIKKVEAANSLVVGDVLVSSWGWEQTNIDFYEVVKVSGSFVTVREIKCNVVSRNANGGNVVPVPGEFIGDPIRRKVVSGWIPINSYAGAKKADITDLGDVREYSFTDYA